MIPMQAIMLIFWQFGQLFNLILHFTNRIINVLHHCINTSLHHFTHQIISKNIISFDSMLSTDFMTSRKHWKSSKGSKSAESWKLKLGKVSNLSVLHPSSSLWSKAPQFGTELHLSEEWMQYLWRGLQRRWDVSMQYSPPLQWNSLQSFSKSSVNKVQQAITKMLIGTRNVCRHVV